MFCGSIGNALADEANDGDVHDDVEFYTDDVGGNVDDDKMLMMMTVRSKSV